MVRTMTFLALAALCACGEGRMNVADNQAGVEANDQILTSRNDSVRVLVAAVANIDAVLQRPFDLSGCDRIATVTKLAYEELRQLSFSRASYSSDCGAPHDQRKLTIVGIRCADSKCLVSAEFNSFDTVRLVEATTTFPERGSSYGLSNIFRIPREHDLNLGIRGDTNVDVKSGEQLLISRSDSVEVLRAAVAEVDTVLERPFELRGCDRMAVITKLAHDDLKRLGFSNINYSTSCDRGYDVRKVTLLSIKCSSFWCLVSAELQTRGTFKDINIATSFPENGRSFVLSTTFGASLYLD